MKSPLVQLKPRAIRRDCVSAQMVGATYGRLTVLCVSGRSRFRAGSHIRVLARCECGDERQYLAHHIRQGRLMCPDCSRVEKVAWQRAVRSTLLPSGRTIAQLAAETGIKLNTLFVRWRRGWPEERLSEPPQRRPRV